MLPKTSANVKMVNLLKSYGDEASDFHDKEMPRAGSNHTCLAVTTNDSALKKDKKNYYRQAFLKECKHTRKKKKSH